MEKDFIIKNHFKEFKIDFSKITTVQDVLCIFKSMDFKVRYNPEDVPEILKEMHDKGFFVEIGEGKEFIKERK